jgi:hypothetical protein
VGRETQGIGRLPPSQKPQEAGEAGRQVVEVAPSWSFAILSVPCCDLRDMDSRFLKKEEKFHQFEH